VYKCMILQVDDRSLLSNKVFHEQVVCATVTNFVINVLLSYLHNSSSPEAGLSDKSLLLPILAVRIGVVKAFSLVCVLWMFQRNTERAFSRKIW